jgi:hypothetical protein
MMSTTSKLSLSTVALVLAVAMLATPMLASAAYSTAAAPMHSTLVTFRVVNPHGTPVVGVKTTLEAHDHIIATLFTNSKGLVTFNLAKFTLTTRCFFDFEKGIWGASYTALVSHLIGHTYTVKLTAS